MNRPLVWPEREDSPIDLCALIDVHAERPRIAGASCRPVDLSVLEPRFESDPAVCGQHATAESKPISATTARAEQTRDSASALQRIDVDRAAPPAPAARHRSLGLGPCSPNRPVGERLKERRDLAFHGRHSTVVELHEHLHHTAWIEVPLGQLPKLRV